MSIGGIFLYKSYAYYEEDKEYNVIKGIIPDFSYDVKFAIEVDGTKQDNIPESAIGKENKYYEVTADCDAGIKAEWDYNAWNLKVENINKGTKCKLAFNSTLSEEDYKEYIKSGVSYRRNTYRGKDITSKLTDGSLFKEIESGKFDDIFVGDYIKTTNSGYSVTWLIADLDNYLNKGLPELTKHHATIIPATSLMNASMNSSATTQGGYAGSAMVGYQIGSDGKATTTKVNGTLDTVLTKYINPNFGTSNPSGDNKNHIITYYNILTTNVDNTRTNRFGITNGGASSAWTWYDRQLDLMSEANVYGRIIWSSSGFDTGIDNGQYAIFQLKPELINSYEGTQIVYWLKDVISSTNFGLNNDGGVSASGSTASGNHGVRPRFLID